MWFTSFSLTSLFWLKWDFNILVEKKTIDFIRFFVCLFEYQYSSGLKHFKSAESFKFRCRRTINHMSHQGRLDFWCCFKSTCRINSKRRGIIRFRWLLQSLFSSLLWTTINNLLKLFKVKGLAGLENILSALQALTTSEMVLHLKLAHTPTQLTLSLTIMPTPTLTSAFVSSEKLKLILPVQLVPLLLLLLMATAVTLLAPAAQEAL